MKSRLVWSLISLFVVTLLVAASAQATAARALASKKVEAVVSAEPPSELMFANELQVAVPGEAVTVAANIAGTSTGTAAEVAAAAAETMTDAKGVTSETLAAAAKAESAVSSAVAAKSESEIPVQLDAKAVEKTANTSLRDFLLVFAVLAGFGLVAYLFVSKLKYKNKKAAQFEMKILAQHHLGPKKSLAVVRVAGESILIGMTDHHISMIKSLALLDEDVPGAEASDFRAGFESVFSSAKNAVSPGRETQPFEVTGGTAKVSRYAEAAGEGEDFTISKIRDVVTRQIRQMKTLE
jgi:flagellar protein FliO/FliZ